jgi:hypothetical protein
VVTMSIYGSPDDQAQSKSGLQWFALPVTPKLTQLVLMALEHKGYGCFTPLQSTTRKRRDQAADVQVPAFPDYVFAPMDVRFRLPPWGLPFSGSPQRVSAEGARVCVRAPALPASQMDARDREVLRQRLECTARVGSRHQPPISTNTYRNGVRNRIAKGAI